MVTEGFMPTLIGGAVSQKERELFSLPVRKGGLAFSRLMEDTPTDHESSKKLMVPLVALIILQSEKLPAENKTTKNEIVKKKEQDIDGISKKLKESMTPKEKRRIELAEEKGASGWLNVLPLQDHVSTSNKGDTVALRYDRKIKGLPTK